MKVVILCAGLAGIIAAICARKEGFDVIRNISKKCNCLMLFIQNVNASLYFF